MKIVQVDNFDRETLADVLIAENVVGKRLGDIMVEALNKAFRIL